MVIMTKKFSEILQIGLTHFVLGGRKGRPYRLLVFGGKFGTLMMILEGPKYAVIGI